MNALFSVLLSATEQRYDIDEDEQDRPTRPRRRARIGVEDSDVEDELPAKVHHRQRQKDKVAPVGIDDATQTTLDYIGENLDIKYNVVGNDGGRFHVDVVLTNTGNLMIPACCWAIYFYHMKYDFVVH